MNSDNNLMQKIISLTKRRGFIFQSSEIYGGFESSYDYGPLGVELKNNIKKAWWDEMTKRQFFVKEKGGEIVGLDAAILSPAKVWQASGHLSAGFADELVECKKCHHRFRKDFLKNNNCPDCGGELTEPRKFNLMMKTSIGPVEDDASIGYLRPETCQNIYLNYQNILQSMRLKLPFGIAQIGKAFRNEINPKDFIFRTREFEQMEMQWFCFPKEVEKWFDFWKEKRMKWYLDLGIKKENIRFREQKKEELAHYAKKAVDIEYKFPFGWKEIEGIHDRGDWDLANHSKHSGKDLSYFDDETKEKYVPHIIETSAGVERNFLSFLIDAYAEIKGGRTETTESAKEMEIVLRLNKKIAPIQVVVFPLLKNKPQLIEKAKEIFHLLKPYFVCWYDEAGSVGRRYRRFDEIGVPFALTCDFETLDKNDVTCRDRDTMKQERIKISELISFLKEKIEV